MGVLSKNKGYTLTEIITVIIIIGVLASIALPSYGRFLQQRKFDEATPILMAIYEAQQVFFADNGNYTDDINNLGLGFTNAPEHFTSITPSPGTDSINCTSGETGDSIGSAVPKDGSADIFVLKNGHICIET